jgi:hypothetical protein
MEEIEDETVEVAIRDTTKEKTAEEGNPPQNEPVEIVMAPEELPPLQVLAYATQTLHPGVRRWRETAKQYGIQCKVVRCSDVEERRFLFPLKVRDTRSALRRTKGEGLVMITDAYDVRFLGDTNEITSRYEALVPERNKILLAGERTYEHHHQSLNELAWQTATAHGPYVFPSSCGLMGPRNLVLGMYEELVEGSDVGGPFDMHGTAFCRCDTVLRKACDQSLIGLWAYRNPRKCLIDSGAQVFWSARGEQRKFLSDYAEVVRHPRRRFRNRETNTLPSVLHIPPVKTKKKNKTRHHH